MLFFLETSLLHLLQFAWLLTGSLAQLLPWCFPLHLCSAGFPLSRILCLPLSWNTPFFWLYHILQEFPEKGCMKDNFFWDFTCLKMPSHSTGSLFNAHTQLVVSLGIKFKWKCYFTDNIEVIAYCCLISTVQLESSFPFLFLTFRKCPLSLSLEMFRVLF